MKDSQNFSLAMVMFVEELPKVYFLKKEQGMLMIPQIYVDDIVFGGISNKMVENFVQQPQIWHICFPKQVC